MTALWIGIGVCLLALFLWLDVYGSRQIVRQWARKGGYEIVQARLKAFWPRFLILPGRAYFRVTVRDSKGEEKSGTVRVRKGLYRADAAAKWDTGEEGPNPNRRFTLH